jgi:hypothetical protein
MFGDEFLAYVLELPTAGVARPPFGSAELFVPRAAFEAPVFTPPRAE